MVSFVASRRPSVSTLGATLCLGAALCLAAPAYAAGSCVSAAQNGRGVPLADPRPYQPVNGTGGLSVFGANTVPGGGFSVGLGYLGEDAVCQQQEGLFDMNTLWLAVAYGITDRLQIGFDVPYTWYEADKAGFDGSGFDDLPFGVLYRFFDEGPSYPALGILGFAVAPTGERSEGIGRNEWDLGGKLIASKTLPGGLLGHANAGYTYAGRGGVKQHDQFTSGVALEWPVNRYFSLVGEALADTNRRVGDDKSSDWVAETRAGFRVRWGPLLVSVAGRKGLTSDAPDWGVFVLVTYTHTPAAPTPVAAVPGPAGAPTPAVPPGPPAAAPGAPAPPAAAPGAPVSPGAPTGPAAPATPGAPPSAAAPQPGAPAPGTPGAPARPLPPGAAAPSAPAPGTPTAPGAPPAPAAPAAPPAVAAVPPAQLPAPVRAAVRDINFEFDRYDLTDAARSNSATSPRPSARARVSASCSRATPTSGALPSTTWPWASDGPRR